MTPWFKTVVASIVFFISLFLFVQEVYGAEDVKFKMCIVSLDKEKQKGCWVAKDNKVLPFEKWLKQADTKAVYIKTLIPEGSGIAKVYYK